MIYCLEDDSSIRDLMIYTLTIAGFETVGFAESTDFWEAVHNRVPQLVLLDIMLPKEDGLTVLKKLRSDARTKDIPVIMATARGSEYDRVIGLDMGADDYLSKPFGMMEMVSRIKAVLRRASNVTQNSILEYGPIRMDPPRRTVSVNGEKIILTLKEYELLHVFLEHPGIVFTRDQLLSHVWDISYAGETRTVDVHIGTLRTKLKEAGELICTVRGVGYRLESL